MIIKTEDITHHSKRTQAENIEKQELLMMW